jgi:DNA polymerase-3 subunit delta'
MSLIHTNPWLVQPFERLGAAAAQGRFPHALLISGQPGLGKTAFADELARFLICETPVKGTHACGKCTGCTLFEAGNHPDFHSLSPEEDSRVIKVDQIRALSESLSMSRHGSGFKVAILDPADAMNINAANSLLKTLEEPTDNTVLVLVSARPGRLPATVRSRCQQVRIPVPERGQAVAWLTKQVDTEQADIYLSLANGAPLLALQLAQGNAREERARHFQALVGIFQGRQDPVAVAASWSKDEDQKGLHWLREWLMDLLRIRLGGRAGEIHGIDLAEGLQALARQMDCKVMFGQLDCVNRALQLAGTGINRQLMTEDILLAWAARTA